MNEFLEELHYFISMEVVWFQSGEQFLESFKIGEYQIIFIEHYLEGILGIEVARQIRKVDNQVVLIFETKSNEIAVEGYKVQAKGYLVKPFTYEELKETFSKLSIKSLEERQFIELPSRHGKTDIILLNDILYCDITGHYCFIHLRTKEVKKFRMSFYKLRERLKPYPKFIDCYSGCIVNMTHIQKINDIEIVLKSGDRVLFRKGKSSNIKRSYFEFLQIT